MKQVLLSCFALVFAHSAHASDWEPVYSSEVWDVFLSRSSVTQGDSGVISFTSRFDFGAEQYLIKFYDLSCRSREIVLVEYRSMPDGQVGTILAGMDRWHPPFFPSERAFMEYFCD